MFLVDRYVNQEEADVASIGTPGAVRAGDAVPARADQAGRQPWSVLVLLCVAQFMVVLDCSIITE